MRRASNRPQSACPAHKIPTGRRPARSRWQMTPPRPPCGRKTCGRCPRMGSCKHGINGDCHCVLGRRLERPRTRCRRHARRRRRRHRGRRPGNIRQERVKNWVKEFLDHVNDLHVDTIETFQNEDGSRVTSRWVLTGTNNGILGTEPNGKQIAMTGTAVWTVGRRKATARLGRAGLVRALSLPAREVASPCRHPPAGRE